ncbi:coiled-coil domain-containing protein 177-like isoform X2 [Limulus polyphemus]|uniref:Coiled-coil domain-containing protein 177-like isoform X2 n=1 Tax=Limulus polyphemus TaxID=6850 RepID=A0ABM1T492_LIMPO|nr:coiled-coil domain-containing protein 177-like isoform X2 [Limulus polyphemus]
MTESEQSGEWTQLHLNLYNFDTSEAQDCPYVLTSPRSLEACSRIGVRPVQLLQKSLRDFEEEYGNGRTKDEVLKLFQDYEANRLRNLERCRDERQKLMLTAWEKQRSQSLSPRNSGMKNQGSFSSSEKITGASSNRDSSSERNDNVTTSTSSSGMVPEEQVVQSPRAQSTPKNRPKSSTSTLSVRDINVTSFSVPSSPYRYLFEEKVSPASSALLKSKLCDSPRAKTKLYPKDIRLMELMVKRYQYRIEEEEKKAEAKKNGIKNFKTPEGNKNRVESIIR